MNRINEKIEMYEIKKNSQDKTKFNDKEYRDYIIKVVDKAHEIIEKQKRFDIIEIIKEADNYLENSLSLGQSYIVVMALSIEKKWHNKLIYNWNLFWAFNNEEYAKQETNKDNIIHPANMAIKTMKGFEKCFVSIRYQEAIEKTEDEWLSYRNQAEAMRNKQIASLN